MVLKKAFSLIELLIVVAIIAILAAIAVPNFLEAQVRSKVARAQADMRSIATALEAYCVDNKSYPFSVCPDTGYDPETENLPVLFQSARDTWPFFGALTTPVAYMTSMPLDPFAKPVGDSLTGGKTCPYFYFSGHGIAKYINSPRNFFSQRSVWCLISLGPNLDLDTIPDRHNYDTYTFYNPKENFHNECNWGSFYDPTNGSTSEGDIYRYRAPVGYLPYKIPDAPSTTTCGEK